MPKSVAGAEPQKTGDQQANKLGEKEGEKKNPRDVGRSYSKKAEDEEHALVTEWEPLEGEPV